MLYGTYGSTLAALLFFAYLCRLRMNQEDTSIPVSAQADNEPDVIEPESIVSRSVCLRLIIFCVSVTLISLCAVVTLVSRFWRKRQPVEGMDLELWLRR